MVLPLKNFAKIMKGYLFPNKDHEENSKIKDLDLTITNTGGIPFGDKDVSWGRMPGLPPLPKDNSRIYPPWDPRMRPSDREQDPSLVWNDQASNVITGINITSAGRGYTVGPGIVGAGGGGGAGSGVAVITTNKNGTFITPTLPIPSIQVDLNEVLNGSSRRSAEYDLQQEVRENFSGEEIILIKELKKFFNDFVNTSILHKRPQNDRDYRKGFVIAGDIFAAIINHEYQFKKEIDIFVLGNTEGIKFYNDIIFGLENVDPEGLVSTFRYAPRHVPLSTPTGMSQHEVLFHVTKYQTREELVEHFNFQHSMVSYYDGMIYISPKTLHCIKNKLLVETGVDTYALPSATLESLENSGWTNKPPKEISLGEESPFTFRPGVPVPTVDLKYILKNTDATFDEFDKVIGRYNEAMGDDLMRKIGEAIAHDVIHGKKEELDEVSFQEYKKNTAKKGLIDIITAEQNVGKSMLGKDEK